MNSRKEILRQHAKRKRDSIPDKAPKQIQAARLFMETFAPQAGRIIALYWPIGSELSTMPLIEALNETGCLCTLPVIPAKGRVLDFARWDRSVPLQEGPHGVQEPVVQDKGDFCVPQILVVPLLAFDSAGDRLGYGGGYYDSTIADLRGRGDVICAGFAYAEQESAESLPAEAHDQRLDYVVTPRGVRKFGERRL